MGQCRLLLMHDTSLFRENLHDASLMIVIIIENQTVQRTCPLGLF